MNRLIQTLLKIGVVCGCVFTAAKFWPSDRWHPSAILAYFPPVLTFFFLLLPLIVFRKSGFWKIMTACCALFCLVMIWLENPNLLLLKKTADSTGRDHSVRILQWNVWGSRRGIPRIAAVISSQHPDIICLNEPKYSRTAPEFPDYKKYLSGDWKEWHDWNVLLLSRYPIQRIRSMKAPGYQGLYGSIETKPPFQFLAIDVAANTEVFRRKVFEELARELESDDASPDIILGDMNTPIGSFSVQSTIGKSYRDSYRAAGNGWGYTWPAWVSLMRIDSILVRSPERALKYRSGSSWVSDHAWQWIDFRN